MRRIQITDPEEFNTLWEGFNVPDRQGLQTGALNHVVRVLDKLEEISRDTKDDILPGVKRRDVKKVPCELWLEEEEFKALQNKLKNVQWQVPAARRAYNVLELLSQAKEEKQPKPPASKTKPGT